MRDLQRRTIHRRGLLVVFLLALSGCANRPSIPTYPQTDLETSLAIARRNMPSELTLEGECTLTDERGRSVRLDVVLALRDAERLRLRAWKFGQAVFDLTLTPEGVWAYSGRPEFDRQRVLGTVGVIRPWLKLFTPVPTGARVVNDGRERIELQSQIESAQVKTVIDRRTLTLRSHALVAGGATRATIEFDEYAAFGEVVWPKRIRVREGKRRIELIAGKLTPSTTAKAFDPPRRAERVAE